ncbi:uncharacterized protein LOC135204171 [Macrobrachium nipponense]|uniref:uncharacterized protein LOC135204171 n=1 Tax=Macrobrachium nipponense TaxID=159736 RepID=UPI0030C7F7AD
MAVVPKVLNRWRGGLVLHLFLHAEWIFLARVFPSCSARNTCSTNVLNPGKNIFSTKFTEGMDTKIETFAGGWQPFRIKFLQENRVQYKLDFVNRISTLHLSVRSHLDKYLIRSDLEIDFIHNEMMRFGLRKEDSRVWVLDVEKGEFLKTVRLTDVSLDGVDDLEVYNERNSRRRKVLFCYPPAPPLTDALVTTCPTCLACPETAPCPECQADCKCEDCSPVTAEVITGTSSQITTRDYPAKVTLEAATCPPCPSTASSTNGNERPSSACPSPTPCPTVSPPPCPHTTVCSNCEDSYPGLTSSVYESPGSGDAYRSKPTELSEPLTNRTSEDFARVYGDGIECPKAQLLLYILEIALALCTLATIVSTALACQYRRKLSLTKTGKRRSSIASREPNEGYRPRGGDAHPPEQRTNERDTLYCHVYEDPYRYLQEPSNRQSQDNLSPEGQSHPEEGGTGKVAGSFQSASLIREDAPYDTLQFQTSPDLQSIVYGYQPNNI